MTITIDDNLFYTISLVVIWLFVLNLIASIGTLIVKGIAIKHSKLLNKRLLEVKRVASDKFDLKEKLELILNQIINYDDFLELKIVAFNHANELGIELKSEEKK